MNTTNAVIDRIKSQHNVTSDYAVSKLLGVTRTSLSDYRHNRRQFSDEIAFRAAKLVDLNPVELLTNLHSERASNDIESELWKSISKMSETVKQLNTKEYNEAINALLDGNATEKQKKLVRESQSMYIMLNW